MADATPGAGEGDFAALVAALSAFRTGTLQGQPSERALAKVAEVRPTTMGAWLKGSSFPQRIDPVLAALRLVRAEAERVGQADHVTAAGLWDEKRWRKAYKAEASRRAADTRGAVEAQQGRAALERMRPGWPLREVSDPFQSRLEVHRAIDVGDAGLPALPAYVPRAHDGQLADVVSAAADGRSGIAVLVGGSSTGKTRACWQALDLLRARPQPWRLWHPIFPDRADAALAGLAEVAPYTVVWLNEAQLYLSTDRSGEQVAAGLRTLLREAARGPLLVLATLWPQHWDALTTRPADGQGDPHAQARELLDGHKIDVPNTFTSADLAVLSGHAEHDRRLRLATEHAEDGQITQYLAGVPVLLDRYSQAPPATKAVIHAAMDARRLGAGLHLPLALLAAAAPGYLTDAQWDQSGEDWLRQALDYVTTPCNGIPGILTPVKTGARRNQRAQGTPSDRAADLPPAASGPLYQLTDYLDQHGRRERADQIPPIDFWTAAATHAHPADLTALGTAARTRGLYRDAAQLFKHATTHGDPQAATALIQHMHTTHPADRRPIHWAVTYAALDNSYAVAGLLEGLRAAGADEQVMVLAARAAAHAALDDPVAVARLLEGLRAAGADEQVTVLAARAVGHAAVDNPFAVSRLLDSLRGVRAHEQVATLLARDPATHVALDDPHAVVDLLNRLRAAGADEQVAVLAARAAAHAALDDSFAVGLLLEGLWEVGADKQVTVLAKRLPAAQLFDRFIRIGDSGERFRFGREPDGCAATQWGWDNLE